MISAYFPFTYVSKATANKIGNIFANFLVYQPTDNLIPTSFNSKLINIIVPTITREYDIKKVVNEYLSWAHTNYGSNRIDTNFFQTTSSRTPFYEKDSITAIRQEIKEIGNSNSEETDRGILFRVCLFLALAHYHDYDNDQVDFQFKNFKTKEKLLTKILQNFVVNKNSYNESNAYSTKNDFGAFMCSERIKSWSTLALQDEVIPDFLITDSTFVVESLWDIDFGVDLLKIGSLPIFTGRDNIKILELIRNLTLKEDLPIGDITSLQSMIPSVNGNEQLVTIYCLPDLSMESFLLKLALSNLNFHVVDRESLKVRNTIIVYIG